jgi:hypothetical protein
MIVDYLPSCIFGGNIGSSGNTSETKNGLWLRCTLDEDLISSCLANLFPGSPSKPRCSRESGQFHVECLKTLSDEFLKKLCKMGQASPMTQLTQPGRWSHGRPRLDARLLPPDLYQTAMDWRRRRCRAWEWRENSLETLAFSCWVEIRK